MPLGLARDGRVDGFTQEMIGLASPKRSPEVGGVFLAEAHIKGAGAGHPHAIAGLAEIVGHRRDKAELAAGLADRDVAGGSTRAIGTILEREALSELRPHQAERQILL